MRRLLTALLVSAISTVTLTATPSATGAATIAGSLDVKVYNWPDPGLPGPPIPHEVMEITAAFPTAVARTVILQVKDETGWHRHSVTTSMHDGTRRFTSYNAPGAVGATRSLRVYAPETTIDGTTYPALLTPTRTFTTVRQTGVLDAPAEVTAHQPFPATGTFTPVRPHRPVVFQTLVDGVWQTIAHSAQNAEGVATRTLTLEAGEHSVRAVTTQGYGGGAPGKATNARTVTATDYGTLTRASVSTGGAQGDAGSSTPAISSNGRYVAFLSDATNLDGSAPGVFVRDLVQGTTTRVSTPPLQTTKPDGEQRVEYPDVTADGRVSYEVYECWTEWVEDGPLYYPITACGEQDVYLWSPATGHVLVAEQATRARVSDDGRYFAYWDSDGVIGFGLSVLDRVTGVVKVVQQHNPQPLAWDISGDGSRVAYRGNNERVYFWNRGAGSTGLVSITSGGRAAAGAIIGRPSISADGDRIAFLSCAAGMVPDVSGCQIFLRDTSTATTTLVSRSPTGGASHVSGSPAISPDGSHVAFDSGDADLVPDDMNGDIDVFLRDLDAGTTSLVSVSTDGVQANRPGSGAAVSADGRRVAFHSYADNLVPGDTNHSQDVFVWERP